MQWWNRVRECADKAFTFVSVAGFIAVLGVGVYTSAHFIGMHVAPRYFNWHPLAFVRNNPVLAAIFAAAMLVYFALSAWQEERNKPKST